MPFSPSFPTPSAGVAATYRTVKVPAGRDIEDATADRKVDGLVALAVEFEEGGRGEGAEDDRGWALGQGDGGLGPELQVDDDGEEGEQDQVDRGGDGHSGEVRLGFGMVSCRGSNHH